MFPVLEDLYPALRQLFEPLRYNLVVDSIIDGHTPAWVYADRLSEPGLALMWNRQDALLLAGEVDDPATMRAVEQIITDEILPDAQNRHIPELAFHVSPALRPATRSIVNALKAKEAGRLTFRFAGPKLALRSLLPPGGQVEPITPQLLRAGFDYASAVDLWVRSFWHSYDDFLVTGFGHCLLLERAIVSWCLTVYASGAEVELGVATVPVHQRRGYATLVAAACVEQAYDRRLTPHWHCWQDNKASIAVAEKIGFVDPVGYVVFRVPTA